MAEEKTKIAANFDLIERNIHDNLLKKLGFRKKGRIWNRKSSDGLIQVINFQVGRYELAGFFTVNIGICVPEISDSEDIKLSEFIRECDCHIRTRLGELSSEKNDLWWDLNKNNELIFKDIKSRLEKFALPFFDALETRDKIIENIEKIDLQSYSRMNLDLGLIWAKKGDLEKAKAYFKKQYTKYPVKIHQEYILKLSKKIGLEF